jgi:hypothetical protein
MALTARFMPRATGGTKTAAEIILLRGPDEKFTRCKTSASSVEPLLGKQFAGFHIPLDSFALKITIQITVESDQMMVN